MKANECMQVLAKHRGDAVVVCALGMAANEWWAVTRSEDSFYMHGGMGLASTFALGLALSIPDTPVWVINSDGGLCMNTGTLLTEAGQQPRNMKHFVVDNQCYQTVENMPMVNQDGADYAMMARGAGFQRAITIDNLDDLERKMPEIVAAPGPLFHPSARRGRARLSARAARDLRRAGDEISLRPRAWRRSSASRCSARAAIDRAGRLESSALDLRELHDLAPLRDVLGDEGAELVERDRERLGAVAGELRLDVRALAGLDQRIRQQLENLRRRSLRCEEAIPDRGIEAGQAGFRQRRQVRQIARTAWRM